jgi:hypothetical protein
METISQKQIGRYAKARVAILKLGNRLSSIDSCTEMVDACIRNDETLAIFDETLKRMGIYDRVLEYQSSHKLRAF